MSRVQARETADKVLIASTCLISLEKELQKMMAPSQDAIRAKGKEHLHQGKADKVKELEGQIKKLGRLQQSCCLRIFLFAIFFLPFFVFL